MKLNINYKYIFLVVFAGLFFAGCAKIVAPTGGPKDEQHPLIVEIHPASYTTNFEADKVKITFDEFIQLKDLNQNLIVSPLLEEKPIIQVKGKTLEIEFEQELEDSTTYNIYFGNSVQDYNEGNPIENFQYVLSTGTYIDSMSVHGQVLNSFNLIPEEGVHVMLYNTMEDSLPFKQIPNYISKTNEEGFFRINNIRIDEYKLFCIRDLNKNYLFDMPEEEIAFIDSIIKFELITETIIDTVYLNEIPDQELINVQDSSNRVIDTIISRPYTHYVIPEFTLMLFEENRAVQYLVNSKREQKQKIEIMFNKAIKDSVLFFLADTVVENDWYIKESSANNDTVFYWLTDSILYNKETLLCAVSYQMEDSNLVYNWNADTLNLKYFEPKKKKKEEESVSTAKFSSTVRNNGALDLNRNIKFTFEKPLVNIDKSKIDLYTIADSVESAIDFELKQDSCKLRNYELTSNWGEDSTYRLEIYPGAFTDISESTNDTSIIEFKTRKLDYYGKILANITGIDSSFQIITQVLISGKDKEKIVRERIVKADQLTEFEYIHPKEYIFKVIIDKNFNGKWDEGNYLEHILPEEVLYYEKEINVKANWDIEIDFNIKKE